MSKRVRSARGESVDFDLLKIKEQIGSAPPPIDVQKRQDFIEKRLRRRLKKVAPPAPKVNLEKKATEPKVKMPKTETLSEEPSIIDEVEDKEVKKTTTRQKTRPVPKAKAE